MKLHSPFIITPRLMAGVQIGGAFISMGAGPRNTEGRTVYGSFIDIPEHPEYEVKDHCSGCGGGDIQQGMESLLSFLGAAAEGYGYEMRNPGRKSENADLFPAHVTEWAYQHSDEITCLEMELQENENLITD